MGQQGSQTRDSLAPAERDFPFGVGVLITNCGTEFGTVF